MHADGQLSLSPAGGAGGNADSVHGEPGTEGLLLGIGGGGAAGEADGAAGGAYMTQTSFSVHQLNTWSLL